MNIENYEHHGKKVFVREDLKGKHREHCLCYSGCTWFRPGREDNCPIAKAVYRNCVEFGIVTPMWECPVFSAAPQLTAQT